MSNNRREAVSERDLLAASSSMDSRRLPGAGPLLKRGVEGSGEKSAATSTQIADISSPRSKRICLETGACTGEQALSHNGSAPSFESQPEDLSKFQAAVEEGNLAVVKHLLKCGNYVDAFRLVSNQDACAPLCTAVKNKHYPVAELLIRLKADVNALNEYGKPPLYYAIQNVHVKMTKLLLNNGSKVENFPELLHLAAFKKSIEIVEALLQKGADVNVRSEFGDTVLHSAVSTACDAIVKSKSATQTDTDETTRCASILNEFIDMFDLLLRFDVNVNLANDEESTPLHISARNGNVEISTLLLNKGANINAKDNYGNTPLHGAVIEGHADVVKLLLERGAETDCYNNFVQSPLHLACGGGNTGIVEILLDFGACIDAETNHSTTPLHLAVIRAREDVVKLLLDRGAQVNRIDDMSYSPLHYAVKRGKTGIIDALLTSGACLNAKTRGGDSPLSFAVYCGREKVVKLLLERGAPLDSSGSTGDTLLGIAAFRGESGIIETLLGFGACVNARSKDSKTALHVASEKNNASAVAVLLDNGADISMKCKESYTALNYAWGWDRALVSRGEYYRNIAVNRSDQRHDTMDLLFRHQVKMEAAGLNPMASSEGGLEDFYLDCQLEITRMKSSFIDNTNISYFHIIKKDTRCVANYLKNKSIVLALECEDYKSEFPIYSGIIGFKFREACPRTKLVERATFVIHRIRGWPEDCTEKVLDFLDDDDLKVFLDV